MKRLDMWKSRERGEFLMPPFWYCPEPAQVEWAYEILKDQPSLELEDVSDDTHDGKRDRVHIDGWIVDVDDDGVWAREGKSEWETSTKGDELVTLSDLPEQVRAVVFALAAYRASYWPGGSNYSKDSPIFALQRLFLSQGPESAQKKLAIWHAG